MARVLVFGAGAIGQWLGAALSKAGDEVTLVAREQHVRAINEKGLKSGLTTVRVQALEEAPSGNFDLVILTVKAFDVPQALDALGRKTSFSQILTLQNGVGTDEMVRERFLRAGMIVGVCTCSVAVPEPGVIHPGVTGGLGLAGYSDAVSVEPWLQRFAQGGLKVQRYADYRSMKWSKLCLNTVGNALGALLDCTPEQLFSDRKLYRFEVRSLGETRKVVYAQNLQILNLPDYPVKKLADVMFWLPSRLSFPLLSDKMSRGRGDKPPSLLLELRRGRHKSEIDFLNGKVVEVGQRVGVPTPVNAALTRAYHQALRDPQAWWDEWRGKPQSLIALLAESERDLQ